MLAIDEQLHRSGRKFRGGTKHDVIAKVINEWFSHGDTDEVLVAGVELMKSSEGTAMRKFAMLPPLKVGLSLLTISSGGDVHPETVCRKRPIHGCG